MIFWKIKYASTVLVEFCIAWVGLLGLVVVFSVVHEPARDISAWARLVHKKLEGLSSAWAKG